jgi:hypothetical protein
MNEPPVPVDKCFLDRLATAFRTLSGGRVRVFILAHRMAEGGPPFLQGPSPDPRQLVALFQWAMTGVKSQLSHVSRDDVERLLRRWRAHLRKDEG